ncbi:bifunctional homocysteine S-methyltransferase/methylenetetrahydrofolate reductase [Bacillus haikouensis]|uniref:bifunctional homocysteine S-methyltransferase/methylenetetrahydrofolate reductase n=1 Tax=Bacillus haikouensis TaxID=1510468 RepID=UPI001554546E|nr:bifunctional homocysteine S-methyltransferase/methylenetetrahydrofolate reductase [Bacillus haikouensis]NQD68743.1 bifunctional homocysteine S-methyltransferase/methylenetetrahydrofolate reductase [Bacillus haikouensis]
MKPLIQSLKERILLADGAMGTLLYSYGVDRCFEELNLSHPDEVFKIHRDYIEAGADIIQTNTYGANYQKLSRYGLEDTVKEINTAAVRLAKKAAGADTYVVGTIGGIRAIKQNIPLEEIKRSFREQLYCLLLEGVDGILLETYYDLEELTTVVKIAKRETDLPVIAQVSMHESGVLQNGMSVNAALRELEMIGADVVGINCRMGPYHMVSSLEEVPIPNHAFLSVYPNASMPNYEEGRFYYSAEPEYFGEISNDLREQGARIIGGCCGTTPEHIRAVATKLTSRVPVTDKVVKAKKSVQLTSPPVKEKLLHQKVKEKKTVIVELDPPKHLDTSLFFQGVKALKEEGIDAITLADNPLASPRIGNDAIGTIVKERYDLTPLVHITCRDRNLIGLQSHLMGIHTLGIHNILAITGDPAKIGDFPGAASVYDLSSLELIELIKQNNEGISFSGKSLRQKTQFSVGAAFNPNFRHLDASVKRLEKKINAGADYFISQPVFGVEELYQVYESTKHLNTPIFIGVMPLLSSRNAEFLHHEVPGIKVPVETRKRMKDAGTDPVHTRAAGLRISKELLDAALKLFNGIYLITPFVRYDMSIELLQYIKEKAGKELEVPYGQHII